VTVPSGIVVVRRNGVISLTGNSGKFQRNVVGGTLDVAGRAVINADPELGLDEVGLPLNQAWDLYRDFIIRRMVQNGNTVLQATKEVAEKSTRAEDALRQVVKERPLHITRAPALHKYSVMAFWPKLIEGDTMRLNSVVQGPFNADNDGDGVVGKVRIRVTREVYDLFFRDKIKNIVI
jgi:DNA-directed RNA polymerase subunit beta'